MSTTFPFSTKVADKKNLALSPQGPESKNKIEQILTSGRVSICSLCVCVRVCVVYFNILSSWHIETLSAHVRSSEKGYFSFSGHKKSKQFILKSFPDNYVSL